MVLSLHIISRCNYGLCNCWGKVHSRGFQRLVYFAKLDVQITPISFNCKNNNNCRTSLDCHKSAFPIFSFFTAGFLFSLIICHFPTPHECIVFSTFLYDRKKFTFRDTYLSMYAEQIPYFFLYQIKERCKSNFSQNKYRTFQYYIVCKNLVIIILRERNDFTIFFLHL